MKNRRSILYVSYTGMLEPLGRSQVLSYIYSLSSEFKFTLISFEKHQDLNDQKAVAELQQKLAEFGVDWKPQTYHHNPRLLATVWDLFVMLRLTCQYSLKYDVSLIHCRSYVPGIIGWICGKFTRKPFVFDMRALWPDEMVTANRLRADSITYKLLKWVERKLLINATKVVSLTDAAVNYLIEIYPELSREKFEVITTCVDTSRFNDPKKFTSGRRVSRKTPFVVGTTGTLLSGWFYLDEFFTFFLCLKEYRPDAIMSIVTRDDHLVVLERAKALGIHMNDIRLAKATPAEMPRYIEQMDVGVMFYAPDIGRAPTRLAEFLATGIPVVCNGGVGDLGEFIRRYGVGIVIDNVRDIKLLSHSAHLLLESYDSIINSKRCREVAEEYFSVNKGVERYRAIYKSLG